MELTAKEQQRLGGGREETVGGRNNIKQEISKLKSMETGWLNKHVLSTLRQLPALGTGWEKILLEANAGKRALIMFPGPIPGSEAMDISDSSSIISGSCMQVYLSAFLLSPHRAELQTSQHGQDKPSTNRDEKQF